MMPSSAFHVLHALRFSFAAIALATLSGCSADGPLNKQNMGAAIGGVTGGLLGSTIGKKGSTGNLIATAGLATGGALVGAAVGKQLDDLDRQQAAAAASKSLDLGLPHSWQNPQSGHAGTVTPGAQFTAQGGGICRNFSHAFVVDGQTQTVHGTACKRPDGTWGINS